MISPGTVLGQRYRLDERIASGGMGDVWRGHDDVLGRTVAVKLLLPSLLEEPGFTERFRGEARTMATISHPGVVDVYDYGSDSAIGAYLVMEYIHGEALSRTLARVGRLTAGRTMALVAQAAEALHAAHQAGVVHRDVKPGNLLVRPDGTLVLTDFGIARQAGAAQLTADGSVLGTASYISPEQAMGERATPLSDIYALGVVAYQCLSGYRPFEGDNPLEIAMRHVREQPPPMPPDVPPSARAVVERAMNKRPADRYPNAAAFAVEARRVAAQLGTSAPQPVMAAVAAGRPATRTSAPVTRPLHSPLGPGGYAGHSGDIQVPRRRSGPSAGTLVALIVAVVVVAVCVGAAIALIQKRVPPQSLPQEGTAATVPGVVSSDGGTDSGGQGAP
jgi:Serine/threonine protein kinase